MQKFQLLLLTYWLDSPVFLKEVARDVVRTVSLCGNLQNMFFSNAQSHLTLTALHEHFPCHTPGLTHPTPQPRLRWDRPCLLLQTSSLATCDSMLGGLPNGLGTLHSGPACASIFLTRVYRKSLCDIFLPPHEE